MRYVIFKTKSGPQLGWYSYLRPSDSFSVGLGTTSRVQRHYCDLDFKILARLYFQTAKPAGIWTPAEYPENNVLTVELEEGISKENLPEVFKMKGFKKFFGNKNIKEVKIECHEH
jgi:hypothetical protein